MKNATETPVPVGSDALVRLLARFREFAACRREVARRYREIQEFGVARHSDAAADFFTRCADELERTMSGEIPADPGCDWPPISETNAILPLQKR